MPAPKNNQNAKKDERDVASSFIFFKCTKKQKARWVGAANAKKTTITKFATEALDANS